MRDRGLTLIELVIAMAVFALIATMGLQAMTGSLRLRDRLLAEDAASAEIGTALALLRADLSGIVPMLFRTPGRGTRSAYTLTDDGGGLALSTGGQADLPPRQSLGMHRVEWRVDPATQTLTRRAWPTLWPASAGLVSPAVPVMQGVTGMSLRSYWQNEGWVDGTDSMNQLGGPLSASGEDDDTGAGLIPNSYTSAIPLGVEITLHTRDQGDLVLVESLR